MLVAIVVFSAIAALFLTRLTIQNRKLALRPVLRSFSEEGSLGEAGSIINPKALLLAAQSAQQLGSSSDGGVDAAVMQSSGNSVGPDGGRPTPTAVMQLSAVAGNESHKSPSSAGRPGYSPSPAASFLFASVIPAKAGIQNITSVPSVAKVMRVTAYCACPRCCGKRASGVTASGYKIQPGDKLIAAGTQIPFGTRIVIPGYNGGRSVAVRDRGKAITGDKLDVYFESHAQARAWGVREIEVRIID